VVNDVRLVHVHPALSVPLRKRIRVLDPAGVEGTVVGFKSTTTTWSYMRPTRTSWVIVENDGGLRSYRAASELRVVERTAVNYKQEGQTA
jgi:hypothetical protein